MKGDNLERLCVACRKLDKKEHLIRFVRLEGKAVPDPTGKIQARGAYVCRKKECLDLLMEKHLLRKVLKTPNDEEALREAMAFIEKGAWEVRHG